MKKIYILSVITVLTTASKSQISITTSDFVYTQYFNTLDTATSSGSSNLPEGWHIYETGSSANNLYRGGNGSLPNGDFYSFGKANNTQRALGSLCAGSIKKAIYGVRFQNNSGISLNSFEIGFKEEQWRSGDTVNISDSVKFYYSLNATGVNDSNATWVEVPALLMKSLVTNQNAVALNGDNIASVKYAFIKNLNIPANSQVSFKWFDWDSKGADDGIAIDSFSVKFYKLVEVETSTALKNALNAAQAGQTIWMKDGLYNITSTGFRVTAGINGTASLPITLKGSKNAVLSNSDSASGYALFLRGNSYWKLTGFTTRKCKVGIKIDSSHYITVDDVHCKRSGAMAIQLSRRTSNCIVKNCYIDSTGIKPGNEGIGEGIYIGIDADSWCSYNYCVQDSSNYNQVLNNTFGPTVRAENIDIKEGTKGGVIKGNVLNGTGLSNTNGANSLMDVKGNYYIIEDNVGTNPYLNGFETHIKLGGWGNYNTFRNNTVTMSVSGGYGVWIQTNYTINGTPYTALNNIVCDDNTINGTSSVSNVALQNCSSSRIAKAELLTWSMDVKEAEYVFSWSITHNINLHHYEIEQSIDGRNFFYLESSSAEKLSNEKRIDQKLVKGSFFRLVMVNITGERVYSNIIQLVPKQNGFIVTSANNTITVFTTATEGAAAIYDVRGAIIQSVKILPGRNNIFINRQARGVYFIKLTDKKTGISQTRKIIL